MLTCELWLLNLLTGNRRGGGVLKQNKSRSIGALFLDARSHARSCLIVLAPASDCRKSLGSKVLNRRPGVICLLSLAGGCDAKVWSSMDPLFDASSAWSRRAERLSLTHSPKRVIDGPFITKVFKSGESWVRRWVGAGPLCSQAWPRLRCWTAREGSPTKSYPYESKLKHGLIPFKSTP